MPKKEGLETIIELRRDRPEIKIIAIFGGSRKMTLDALEMARFFGAHHVMARPFDAADFLFAVRTLLNEAETTTGNLP